MRRTLYSQEDLLQKQSENSASGYSDDITSQNSGMMSDMKSVEEYISNDAKELDFLLKSELNIHDTIMDKVINDFKNVRDMLNFGYFGDIWPQNTLTSGQA